MATILGDCMLAGAFLTYSGFFDHFYRKYLYQEWRDTLEKFGIKYKTDTALIEFLVKPTERLIWQSNNLPTDDLCVENAIILKYFNRYPLIIDPSGQALQFILKNYADKKIQKTSFADESFMK